MQQNDRRSYMARHTLDELRALNAIVAWNGKGWIVKVDDDVVPDCCDTIEDAFTVAEAEIMRRAPNHTCTGCQPWQPSAEDLGL